MKSVKWGHKEKQPSRCRFLEGEADGGLSQPREVNTDVCSVPLFLFSTPLIYVFVGLLGNHLLGEIPMIQNQTTLRFIIRQCLVFITSQSHHFHHVPKSFHQSKAKSLSHHPGSHSPPRSWQPPACLLSLRVLFTVATDFFKLAHMHARVHA